MRSSRPIWLGPVHDARGWDHVRLHLQLLRDARLGSPRSLPKRSVVLAIYWGLAAHAELESGASRPSAETLARYAGCDEKTARRAIAVLALAGYIEVTARPGMASLYRLLPPPEIPAEADHGSAGTTPDLPDDPSSTGAGTTPEGSGHHARSTPGTTPDEQEPYNEISSSSSREAEAEARQSAGRDAHGFELLQLVAERVDDPRCRHQLWRPEDQGARVLLARRLVHLEDLGWQPDILAVELAGGLVRPAQIQSSAAVLLTRARTLRAVLAGAPTAEDPAAARQRALVGAHRYGENLAQVADLAWAELVVEAEHAYPDDPERVDVAVQAARRARAHLEAAG